MSDQHIPYGRQSIEADDIEAVLAVLRGDWLTTGPAVDAFEDALSQRCGAPYAVALNSGTAALHAAYRAAGVGPGTEVIVPALTFSATANAAHHLGATLRFADITDETLTIDPASLQQHLSEKTVVVAPVDFAGHPADIDAITAMAARAGARVVEDAAHSLGATYRGQAVGCVADLTTFSFHPVKAITTGEGGAVTTRSTAEAQLMRRFRNHGIDRHSPGVDDGAWSYDIDEIGFNFRLTDIQCALGISQLRKLGRFIERRQQIAATYRQQLATFDEIELPPDQPWCEHAYHLFVIRVPSARRAAIFDTLRSRGIGVQVHYVPVNMLSAYRRLGHHPEETPVALKNYRRMISLPCHPAMGDADVERVIAELGNAMRGTQ